MSRCGNLGATEEPFQFLFCLGLCLKTLSRARGCPGWGEGDSEELGGPDRAAKRVAIFRQSRQWPPAGLDSGGLHAPRVTDSRRHTDGGRRRLSAKQEGAGR